MGRTLTVLAAVLAISTMIMGTAHAACEWKHRIPHGESECLSAEWENPNRPLTISARNWVTAQSTCSDLGRVVVKIDLVHEMDRTWHLHNNQERRGEYSAKIRGVYCCRDLGVCRRPR